MHDQIPSAQPAPDHTPWLPYLSDRADGVRGHYALARWNPRGYREVWNLRGHGWSAFSDDVLTLDEAHALLQTMAPVAPAATQAQAEPEGRTDKAYAVPLEALHLIEDAAQAHDQCRAVVHLALALAEVHVARAAILASSANAPVDVVGQSSAAIMESLADWMSGMDAVDEADDSWIDLILDRAHARWPSPAASAPVGDGWQTIETTPLNTTILLYGAKRLEMCVGMHHSRDGWVLETTSEWTSMYTPTHWQPLPPAPARAAQAKGGAE